MYGNPSANPRQSGKRCLQHGYRELQILKQREIQAICQPRLTEAEVTHIAELPKTPHPSQRPAVQNEPKPPAPEQDALGEAIDIGDPLASS